jgi:hypothetical protein
MARKAKDLFVLLAERHQHRSSTSTSSSRNDSTAKNRDPAANATAKAKDAAATIKDAGGTLGRWVRGAVRTLRGEAPAKPGRASSRGNTSRGNSSRGNSSRANSERGTAAGRRAPPRQVPRGLLVPGWLLVGMVTVALGGGFLIGKFTSGFQPNSGLDSGTAQKPGNFRSNTPDLTPAQEMAELGNKFYVLGTFFPEERDVAAKLARDLRDRGVAKARILRFAKNGSTIAWATVCYVAPSDARSEVLAALKRHEEDLHFEVVPGLQQKS